MSEVTRILEAVGAGDSSAAARLLPLVYDELRKLAAHRLARESPGQTLQPTALVHEAYLRLVGEAAGRRQHWDGRGHFFAAAAEAMRRILVDNARKKLRLKRGGRGRRRDVHDFAAPERPEELLALDEALSRLASASPQAAQLVNLRHFAGLTNVQAAAVLEISPRKADQVWAYARAWLRDELTRDE